MVLRRLIPALSILLTFTPAEAQERPQAKPASSAVESFETLTERVQPGATVYVTDAASGEVEGRLVRLSPASVTLLVQGTEREFLKNDLREVARRGDSLKNGALIGLKKNNARRCAGRLRDVRPLTSDARIPRRR
jgi:hypothetical protein